MTKKQTVCLLWFSLISITAFAVPLLSKINETSLPCDDYEGTITFIYDSPNDTSSFNFQFVLVDTNDVIQQVSYTPSFTNVVAGVYAIHTIDYQKNSSLQGAIVGNKTSQISGDCISVSSGFFITICKKPDNVKTISGIVFNDRNEDGVNNDGISDLIGVTLKLYEDINQNGLLDEMDSLLNTTLTRAAGVYNFIIDETAIGRTISHVLIQTDSHTTPLTNYYTTDNIETAIFTNIIRSDNHNDFGLGTTVNLENEVWLDLNGNGLRETVEINIPNIGICISNLAPLLINGIIYPPNTYMDTVYTDLNGTYTFNNLPDCDWQLVIHYDQSQYVPTYDADGIPYDSTVFKLNNGAVLPSQNAWCAKSDCIDTLDFGLRPAGNLRLTGTVCIDDGSKDGNCGTGTETLLASKTVNIFTDKGDKLGGVFTNELGNYLFPFLSEGSYIVDLPKEDLTDEKYFFTTQEEDTPASTIVNGNYSIFQKVDVQNDVFGLDFAFFPHDQPFILARDDYFTSCPGIVLENEVSSNDFVISDIATYVIVKNAKLGEVEITPKGTFSYQPFSFECTKDTFAYQVCDILLGICDTATVVLGFEDNTAPKLINVPANITISCDEQFPAVPLVSTFDNCPRVSIDIQESSTQGEDGCSQHDYVLTRTWTSADACGNTYSEAQSIDIQDLEAPNIFRNYTLPNDKKLVGGVSAMVRNRWKTISLPIDFPTTPLVFYQVISNNDSTPVIAQIRNISKNQFEIRLQEEENNDGLHQAEKVAWIAIEKSNQGNEIELIANNITVDDKGKNIDFNDILSSSPLLFTNLQTTYEDDPVTILQEQITQNSAKVTLVEEKSKDAEILHTKEELGYLAIENKGNILDKEGNIMGELRKMDISNGWNTIQFNHQYYNPVLLVSSINQDKDFPYTIRVRQLTSNGFQVKIQAWDYLNYVVPTIPISFFVMEGSLPLYVPNFCQEGTDHLRLGQDILAIDNCDANVELKYFETSQFDGTIQNIQRKWSARDECGNQVAFTQEMACEGIGVKLQTFLQGALVGSLEDGLMRDDLRRKKLIPIEEPYTSLSNFQHYGSGGGEILDTNLLAISGENAIVDWVFVELRSDTTPDQVIATSAGLLQRDGDIISATGDSIITFRNINFDDYFLAIRHRNHIGIGTKNVYTFQPNLIPEIDFRNVFTPIEGNQPSIKISNRSAQWAGDLNGDNKTIYQGPQNDPFELFLEVLLHEQNEHALTNYIVKGYTSRDFNLDGIVIFQGPNNDRASFLVNTTLSHPDNPFFFANFVITVSDKEP